MKFGLGLLATAGMVACVKGDALDDAASAIDGFMLGLKAACTEAPETVEAGTTKACLAAHESTVSEVVELVDCIVTAVGGRRLQLSLGFPASLKFLEDILIIWLLTNASKMGTKLEPVMKNTIWPKILAVLECAGVSEFAGIDLAPLMTGDADAETIQEFFDNILSSFTTRRELTDAITTVVDKVQARRLQTPECLTTFVHPLFNAIDGECVCNPNEVSGDAIDQLAAELLADKANMDKLFLAGSEVINDIIFNQLGEDAANPTKGLESCEALLQVELMEILGELLAEEDVNAAAILQCIDPVKIAGLASSDLFNQMLIGFPENSPCNDLSDYVCEAEPSLSPLTAPFGEATASAWEANLSAPGSSILSPILDAIARFEVKCADTKQTVEDFNEGDGPDGAGSALAVSKTLAASALLTSLVQFAL